MSAAFHRQAATRRSRIPLPLLTAHSSARYVAVSLYAPSCDASISPLRPHAPCIRRRLRLLISLLCLLLSTIKTIIYSLLMLIFSYFFALFKAFFIRFAAVFAMRYRLFVSVFHVKHFELSTLFYLFLLFFCLRFCIIHYSANARLPLNTARLCFTLPIFSPSFALLFPSYALSCFRRNVRAYIIKR